MKHDATQEDVTQVVAAAAGAAGTDAAVCGPICCALLLVQLLVYGRHPTSVKWLVCRPAAAWCAPHWQLCPLCHPLHDSSDQRVVPPYEHAVARAVLIHDVDVLLYITHNCAALHERSSSSLYLCNFFIRQEPMEKI